MSTAMIISVKLKSNLKIYNKYVFSKKKKILEYSMNN